MPTKRPLRTPLAHPEQAFASMAILTFGWVRLHWPSKALRFAKDTGHRFTPERSPYEVLYLARDEATAAAEVFYDRLYQKNRADIPASEWMAREFSSIEVPHLKLANLFSARGLEMAQIDTTALEFNDLAVPQSWALSVMTHPEGFHGMVFGSRFTKGPCLALFGVPGDPPPVVVGKSRPFRESVTAAHILRTFRVSLT